MDKRKILIVEDDLVLQKSLVDFLIAEGFEISNASNGEEGVARAKEFGPDLIILDIILPKKDGYEVIRDLKDDQNTKNIPIVLLTNLGGISDVQRALDLGATTYLIKADYKLEEISKKIKDILKLR